MSTTICKLIKKTKELEIKYRYIVDIEDEWKETNCELRLRLFLPFHQQAGFQQHPFPFHTFHYNSLSNLHKFLGQWCQWGPVTNEQ
jgi:hypothetical protein